METKTQNSNGFFGQIRAYLSKDGEYLITELPGNMRVVKHVNFYKAVLKVPFTPKVRDTQEEAGRVA